MGWPYGETKRLDGASESYPTDRLFTGMPFRETIGLCRMGARWFDPYLNAFVYTSRCDALSELQGKFNMQFAQVQRVLLWRLHLTADVSINTESSTMDIEYLDYTGLGLRTDGLAFDANELGFGEVARIARDYILATTRPDCDVTIIRIRQAWLVRCGPLENLMQKCSFQIDRWTGKISPGEG